MLTPPFRSALLPSSLRGDADAQHPHDLGAADVAPTPLDSAASARPRLAEMDAHLHCSVIGTCLSTTELRKLMGRFIPVDGTSDLDVHHEAVRLTSLNADVARTLHKALDRRHDAAVKRFAPARSATELAALWEQSLTSGEVPGAYWAVLTHRSTTPELRARVFGDVHMLSHLVGAANRADIRRVVALEQENGALRERGDRQQERLADLIGERDEALAERDALRVRLSEFEREARSAADGARTARDATAANQSLLSMVALQTRRREAAEAQTATLRTEVDRLGRELEHLADQATELGRELGAAEAELRDRSKPTAVATSALHRGLAGKRLLYVGGRPSSNAAIRDLVLRHGGDYQRHDGGIEDRKGLLASALAWADLVVFPVDCVDHDSALVLKRHCLHQGLPFLALRSASVASLAAALTAMAEPPEGPDAACGGPCLKHG